MDIPKPKYKIGDVVVMKQKYTIDSDDISMLGNVQATITASNYEEKYFYTGEIKLNDDGDGWNYFVKFVDSYYNYEDNESHLYQLIKENDILYKL